MKVRGIDEIEEQLVGMTERLADLRPAWVVVRQVFYNIEKALFASNGGTGASGKWADLSEITIRKKIAAGYGAEDILQATTALKKSLTAPNQRGSRFIAGPQTLEIGTTIFSALFHSEGTEHMPARSPIDPTEEDMIAMVGVVDRWVRGVSLL